MMTLLKNLKKSSNQPKSNYTAQDFTKQLLRLDFKKYDSLQRMRDSLSSLSYDFEILKVFFNESHPACADLLSDCLSILKSARCTISREFIAASVNYRYAKDVFVMAIFTSQTTIDECLAIYLSSLVH
jgi:hypothetical protein